MMKKSTFILVSVLALLAIAAPALAGTANISATSYKAGDVVTIEGAIAPGQDLYIAIAQQKMFAPGDTDGVHETKRLKKDAKKAKFNMDTKISPLYYMLTNNPDAFGKVDKKKFGGPSVILGKGNGIYSTTMFYLEKDFNKLDATAKASLGPIQTADQ